MKLLLVFLAGLLDIRCESDDYEVLTGANASDVSKQFAKMWGIKLINYPAFFKSRCENLSCWVVRVLFAFVVNAWWF